MQQHYICYKKGHFAILCKSVKTHHIVDENSNEELFFIRVVKCLSNKQCNECHKVTCILPFTDYVKATEDKQGTKIIMHNNTSAVPVGKVME